MTEEVIIKVGTTGDGSVDKLNKNIENISKNAIKASSEVLKMKSAFDVVNASLNVATTSGDKFINKLLSIRFPQVGQMAEKEVKILYQAFTQAERIGSEMFDMASLAAKVFKGDMNQVNLAIAQYNELFEKNTGVDGITLNTSALLALRNQVISTGSSVSILNKEIGQMSNIIANNTGIRNINTSFNESVNIIRELETELNRSSDYLKILGLESTNISDGINISSEAATKFATSLDKSVSSAKELYNMYDRINMVLSASGDELEASGIFKGNGSNTVGQLEAHKSSIIGLREQISLLERQFELMPKLERDAFGEETTTRIAKLKTELASASASIGGFATSAKNSKPQFNQLSNSILQVGRELPNFAISANIGFMAISNNLPILGEAISEFRRMRAEVIEFNKTAAVKQEVPNGWKALKGAIFNLGGALTLISGLFLVFGDEVIKRVIDWINKIPKDLEIKIGIENDAYTATKNYLELIKEIKHQQNLLSTDKIKNSKKETALIQGNIIQQLNSIRDGAGEEYKIAKNKDKWLAEFAKTENERQRKLAYNKVLFNKQADAQIIIAQEKNRQDEILKSIETTLIKKGRDAKYIKDFIDAWKKGNIGFLKVVEEGLTGETNLWNESIDKLKNTREENKTLLSLKPEDVYSITKNKGSAGSNGSTKSTYSTPSLKDIPEVVTAEKVSREQIKWEEYTLAEKTRLQEEQQIISKEISGRKIPLTGGEFNVFQELEYDVRLLKASLEDMNKEYATLSKRKSELEGYKTLFEEESKNVTTIYDTIDKTNVSLAEKQNQLNALLVKEKELEAIYSKSKNAGEAKKNKEAIDSIKGLISSKQDEIETDKNHLKILEKGLADAKERQSQYKAGSDEYKQISQEMLNLDIAIDAEKEALHDRDVQRHREKINMAKEYLDALSNLAGGFADIAQGNMDLTNAEYDQKIWANDEMVQSDEQRADNAYKIEMERWQALQKNFEMQKKMKEAQAWMDFASGSVGIWTAPGITSLAPFGFILAGIQQAALLATTIGNVKSIRSQQMLKPHKGNGGSSGGASSANIALNPAKDALTSRDENLNTMAKANQKDAPTNVVKVSEINDVQSRVKVREENASY